ncbi:ribulose-phosphate 3-epimerase [Megamonas funiformis]|uniref:ribulose-phosphate 3-epimerase n=1 Tax=Megamonas funiformis TaxID=437897 RepID=UPI00388ED3F9
MEKLLCPSMMCAKYENLAEEIKELEEANIDIFHIDIMDGDFVPNFGMGLQDTELICKLSLKKVDVHLMINNPSRYIKKFADLGVDIIYIHPESERQPIKTLQEIRELGKEVGIVLSPEISVDTIKPLLSLIDYVMVMTVNPGFAGQKYLSLVDEKIDELVEFKDKYNFKILIDGAWSEEKIKTLSLKGVQGFVLGTSALFNKNEKYKEIIPRLRNL